MFHKAEDILTERIWDLKYWQCLPVWRGRICHVSTELSGQINILDFVIQGVIHHLFNGAAEFYNSIHFSRRILVQGAFSFHWYCFTENYIWQLNQMQQEFTLKAVFFFCLFYIF